MHPAIKVEMTRNSLFRQTTKGHILLFYLGMPTCMRIARRLFMAGRKKMSWSRYLTGLNLYVLPDPLDRILLPASLTGLQASSEELYSYSKIYQRRDPTELLEVPRNVSSFPCMMFAVLTSSQNKLWIRWLVHATKFACIYQNRYMILF